MKKLFPRLMFVAAFLAAATMAEAQAVPRGSGGGGGGSSSSAGSSGGGGGATTSSSSGGGGSTYSPPSPPTHSAAPPRTPSHSAGSSGGGASVSRSGSSSRPGSYGTASRRTPESGSVTSATAPTYSRPDGRPLVGYAVPRTNHARPPLGGGGIPIYIYDPWTWGWGFGSFGYGYGLGYLYDPFYSGYYGYPWGMGYYGGGYDYYGSGGYYGGGGYYDTERSQDEALQGQLRLKVKPREAKVIVDGTFMGTVDDFDGMFQKLTLPEGRHQVSLQLEGYEPLNFAVMIVAGETVNYEGHLQKIGDNR